jgi:hypothetical protein
MPKKLERGATPARRGAEARAKRRSKQQGRKRIWRWIFVGCGAIFALAIITSFFLPTYAPSSTSSSSESDPWDSQEIQGGVNPHVILGEKHPPYNTNPPTSGWHYGNRVAPWGISESEIPNEIQVHNLEHGGVIIQYNNSDPEFVSQVEEVAAKQPRFPCYIVVAPYPNMSSTIALTAWGVIQTLTQFDEASIQAFINAHVNRGPEQVPCNPGDNSDIIQEMDS